MRAHYFGARRSARVKERGGLRARSRTRPEPGNRRLSAGDGGRGDACGVAATRPWARPVRGPFFAIERRRV